MQAQEGWGGWEKLVWSPYSWEDPPTAPDVPAVTWAPSSIKFLPLSSFGDCGSAFKASELCWKLPDKSFFARWLPWDSQREAGSGFTAAV